MSFLLAKVYDVAIAHMERACLSAWRHEMLGPLRDSVLELGAGTGRNLQCYGPEIEHLTLTEPDRHMRLQLALRLRRSPLGPHVELFEHPAEQLGFADASFDAVVSTLVLCSVDDPEQSVREMYRVLRPGGRLLLIEHILSPEGTRLRRWQRLVNPMWSRLSGGCRLDRDPRAALLATGFITERMVLGELRGAPGILHDVVRGVWRKPERA